MASLLCQKTNNGIIKCENQELLDYVLNSQQSSLQSLKGNGNNKDGLKSESSSIRLSNLIKNYEINNSSSSGQTSSMSQNYSRLNRCAKSAAPVTVMSDSNNSTITGYSYQQSKTTPGPSNTKLIKSAIIRKSKSSAIDDILNEKALATNKLYRENMERLAKRKISSKKIQLVQQWLDSKLNKKLDSHECYNKLNELISDRKELIQEIDKNILKSDISNLRKKELLYKNWYLNVYEPIQKEIFNNMSGPNADYAREVRYFKYLEYLNYVNKYGGVFINDFEPEEYDPAVISLDANVGMKLKDPTNLAQRKFHREENTILKCQTGKMYTLDQVERKKIPVVINKTETRNDLDWNNWLLDQYNTIESTVRHISAKKCQPYRHDSEYNINWNRDQSSRAFTSSNNVYVDHSKTTVKCRQQSVDLVQ